MRVHALSLISTINEPDHSAERILIDCGQQSVLLMKGKIDSGDKILFVSAVERIGQNSLIRGLRISKVSLTIEAWKWARPKTCAGKRDMRPDRREKRHHRRPC